MSIGSILAFLCFLGNGDGWIPIMNEFWEMIVFKNLKLLVMWIFWSLLSCRLSSENLTVVVMTAAGNQLFNFLSLSVFITVNAWRLLKKITAYGFGATLSFVGITRDKIDSLIFAVLNKRWHMEHAKRNNMHLKSWLFWRAPHAALNLTVTIQMLLFRVQRESLCWGEMRAAWQQPCTQTPARYYSTHPPSTNRC